jgi:hypothetical protein
MSNSAEELRQHIRNAVASLTIEEIRNICSLYSIIVRFFQKKVKISPKSLHMHLLKFSKNKAIRL